MTETAEQACARAIKKAGNDNKLALAIGLSRVAVGRWKKIPAERVPAVSEATGIPRYQLRPDLPHLFPPPKRATTG